MPLLTALPSAIRNGGFPAVGPGVAVGDANVYYVSSVADLRADDPSHGKTPLRPFATWDYAIGRISSERQNSSKRGDVIVLGENHAETITTATALAMDVAGVRVIGMGHGSSRPTITFTTVTNSSVFITASDCEIANIVFVNGVDSQASCIDIDGSSDGTYIHDCEFKEGSSTTGLTFITVSGTADDVRIENNRFYQPTAGNGDYAVRINAGGACARVQIKNNYIFGDFDVAGIGSTNSCTAIDISGNSVVNLLAGQAAIEFTATDVTGTIAGNNVSADIRERANSLRHLVGDQTWRLATCPYVFASHGGSVGTVDIFTVTGDVEMGIYGICKASISDSTTTATLEVGVSGNTAVFIAQLTAGTQLLVNEIWHDASPTTTIEATVGGFVDARMFVNSGGQDVIMTIGTAAISAGSITFYSWWRPLSANGNVVSALS